MKTGKIRKRVCAFAVLMGLAFSAAVWADLDIDHVNLRIDQIPLTPDGWEWTEGWVHWRQYYPDHFRLGATVHVFVKNTGTEPAGISEITLDNADLTTLITSPEKVGPVVWYRLNPRVIEPGAMGVLYLRLRNVPEKPIDLNLVTTSGQDFSCCIGNEAHERLRLGSVNFNAAMDKAYIYVDNYTDESFQVDQVFFDGLDVTDASRIIEPNALAGRPALIELSLEKALQYGDFHCFKVTTRQGASAMYQVRVRDDRFHKGIIRGKTALPEYHAKFFNLLYSMHGHHRVWNEEGEVSRLGFTSVALAPTAETVDAAATAPPGRIMYTNIDEPDARDFGYRKLPIFQRVGTSIMDRIEPVMQRQREMDPRHETIFIVDRTFAPRNWLDYGEVADVMIQDTYVPTPWTGYDMEVFPKTADTLMAAVSPRPVHMMFWGTFNTGQQPHRAPTPEENDMMVHYAIGSGLKGINYFLDWNSFPTKFDSGFYVGSPRIRPLWKQMGRANAQLERLSSLLSIGHPYDVVKTDNDKVWARSLLCGPDNLLVVLVNRNHRIQTVALKHGGISSIYPVNATVSVELPAWFGPAQAWRVSWDGVSSQETGGRGRRRTLAVNALRTSKMILFSRDPDIESKLQLEPKRMQALLESEKPLLIAGTPPLENVDRPEAQIAITDLANGSLKLNLAEQATLARAMRIQSEGELRLAPGEWLGLFPPESGGGQSELIFRIESPEPLRKVTASLLSQTPNFPYGAHNIVGLSLDNETYVDDSSLRVEWNGGGYGGERLSASIEAEKEKPFTHFFVRVIMRDPGWVVSGEASNILQSMTLSWEQ